MNVKLYDGTTEPVENCVELEHGEHDGEYALSSKCVELNTGGLALMSDAEECNECGEFFPYCEVTAGTCEACFALEGSE